MLLRGRFRIVEKSTFVIMDKVLEIMYLFGNHNLDVISYLCKGIGGNTDDTTMR